MNPKLPFTPTGAEPQRTLFAKVSTTILRQFLKLLLIRVMKCWKWILLPATAMQLDLRGQALGDGYPSYTSNGKSIPLPQEPCPRPPAPPGDRRVLGPVSCASACSFQPSCTRVVMLRRRRFLRQEEQWGRRQRPAALCPEQIRIQPPGNYLR